MVGGERGGGKIRKTGAGKNVKEAKIEQKVEEKKMK